MATPRPACLPSTAAKPPKGPGRALRLEEILTLLVADGLVAVRRCRRCWRGTRSGTQRASARDRSPRRTGTRPPSRGSLLTLDWLVEWLAGKLGVPYLHIDPLKIDLTAVTQTMTNAYAERYRILPVAVTAHDADGRDRRAVRPRLGRRAREDPEARGEARLRQSAGHPALSWASSTTSRAR